MVDKIECSRSVKSKLRKFARQNKCSLNDFIDVLQQSGVNLPAQLVEVGYNKISPTFRVISKTSNQQDIQLIMKTCHFKKRNNYEWSMYDLVSTDTGFIGRITDRNILKNRVQVRTEYSKRGIIKKMHMANVSIEMLANENIRDREKKCYKAIDKYLLRLNTYNIQDIFKFIMKSLNMSDKTQIKLTLTLKIIPDIVAEIKLQDGYYESFAYLEDNKLYQLYANGDWKYRDYNVSIESDDGDVSFCLYGKKSLTMLPITKFEEVEKKIIELFKKTDLE